MISLTYYMRLIILMHLLCGLLHLKLLRDLYCSLSPIVQSKEAHQRLATVRTSNLASVCNGFSVWKLIMG